MPLSFTPFASLEASRRVTNGIVLGCPLFLPVHTVNRVQTLKATEVLASASIAADPAKPSPQKKKSQVVLGTAVSVTVGVIAIILIIAVVFTKFGRQCGKVGSGPKPQAFTNTGYNEGAGGGQPVYGDAPVSQQGFENPSYDSVA
jgi:hypothetical protein